MPKTANRLGTNAFFACSIYPNDSSTKYKYLKLTSLALSTEAEETFDLLFNGFLAARFFLSFAEVLVFNLTFNWPGLTPDFPGIFALALDIVIKLHKVHFFVIFRNFAHKKSFHNSPSSIIWRFGINILCKSRKYLKKAKFDWNLLFLGHVGATANALLLKCVAPTVLHCRHRYLRKEQ